MEKHNKLNKKLNGWAHQQNGGKNQYTRKERNRNTQSEQERENRLKKKKKKRTEQSFRYLWDYNKRSKDLTFVSLESWKEKEKKRSAEKKILKEIMAENSSF